VKPTAPERTDRRAGRSFRVVAVLVACAAAGGLFYRYEVRDNVFPKNFGVVEEGKVYRSGQLSPAAFRSVVEGRRVRTIIDLGSALKPDGTTDDAAVESINERVAESLGVTRYRFNLVGDGTGNPNAYVQALRIMTDPGAQPVLVHCGAGSERTGIAVILYRNLVQGTPIDAGYVEARKFRHDPGRNPKLREVLDRYGEAIVRAVREGSQVPGVEPLAAPRATTGG
jgi:protein tyrosine/serine phosphatase